MSAPEEEPHAGSESRKYQLGILFVHGIGEQPEGETLLRFGQPLVTWLHQWLARDAEPNARGSVEVVQAVLAPSKLQGDVPPHAEVHLTLPLQGHLTLPQQGPSESWLMAESWWGGDVQAPAFQKVAGWMMTVGAWSILSHVTKHIGRRQSQALRVLWQLWALIKWIALASLLQLTVLVLTAFTILPIPGTRKALSSILLALTGVLGDSYVLLESDLQRSAIVNKTRDALQWVAKQCDRVVVIAHSQGAAIAHLALRSAEPKNVCTLVTFGSGLEKLEELLRLRDRPGRIRTAARLMPVFLLLVALLVRIAVFENWDEQATAAVIGLGTVIFFASIIALVRADEHWRSVEQWIPELGLKTIRPDMQWVDVHATHDPVPNGRLSPLETPVATEERPVTNVASVFGDHTSYWENRVQFVPIVATTVADAAKIPMFDDSARAALNNASATHDRRVAWLTVTFWSTLAALALLSILYWSTLKVPGEVVENGLQQLGGPFEKATKALHLIVSELNAGRTPEQIVDARHSVLGVILFATLVLLWQPAYRALWRAWDATALEQVVRPEFLAHPADRFFVDAFVLGVGFAPLATVLGWPWLVRLSARHAILVMAFVFLAALWIAFLVNLVSQGVRLRKVLLEGNTPLPKELMGRVIAFVWLTIFLLILLPLAFPNVPVTNNIGALAFDVFIVVAYGGVVVALHRAMAASVTALTNRRAIQRLAHGVPGTLMLVILTPFLRSGDWRLPPSELIQNWRDVVGTAAGFYTGVTAVVCGVLWLLLRLTTRRSARGLTPP